VHVAGAAVGWSSLFAAAREVQRRKKERCHFAVRTLFFPVTLCSLLFLVKLAHNPL
jgi:hypothetical protein